MLHRLSARGRYKIQKIPRCQLPVYIRGEFKRRGANSNKADRVRKGKTNSKEAERIEKKHWSVWQPLNERL